MGIENVINFCRMTVYADKIPLIIYSSTVASFGLSLADGKVDIHDLPFLLFSGISGIAGTLFTAVDYLTYREVKEIIKRNENMDSIMQKSRKLKRMWAYCQRQVKK